jgi:metabotropic glutamate receptor 2/3/metabotropic glutamate receptor 6/7/8
MSPWQILLLATIAAHVLVVGAVEYNYGSPSNIIYDSQGRISGIQDKENKDFVIGGLVRVHGHEGGGKCGDVLLHKSVENLEALLFAIDLLNSDQNLLPNLTVGYDIYDTCVSESVALDASVDMLVSNGQIDLGTCQNMQVINTTTTPVSAVIGAIVSSVSIPVASFFRIFAMPQISFTSTSTILSDKDRFGYFFRTVPPDDQQAQAMVDLIRHFQWDHVSTVYSNNLYGQPGITAFQRLADKSGICIDINEGLEDSFSQSDYIQIASKIFNASSNVVVLFANINHVEGLLTAINELSHGQQKKFAWIASDGWSELTDPRYDAISAGKWGIAPLSENIPSFNDYYSKLNPNTNLRDPWFNDFYQLYYNCILDTTCTNVSITQDTNYIQDVHNSIVVDTVYSIANALNDFLNDNCPDPLVWYAYNRTCRGYNQSLDGEVLRSYLRKVNFTSPTGRRIEFDENGNIKGMYSILNYHVTSACSTCPRTYRLVNVGYWDGNIQDDHLQFYSNISKQFGVDDDGNVLLQLQSQCQQCPPGFIKRSVTSSCCGTCVPCLGQNYTNSTSTSTQCDMCPQYMWGNSPLNGSTECSDIERSYLKPYDAWAIVLMILAIIGIFSVIFVSAVFIWFWKTPIVKSSGREQMTLILIGILLCFLVTIFFILPPSPAVCGIQRIGIWFCFSLIQGAIFIKLVRITTIFMQGNKLSRPKFTEPIYQIIFTFLVVGGQMVIVLISLIVVYPDTSLIITNNTIDTNDYPRVSLICTFPHIALFIINMIYYTLLVIASNVLAVLTIRFPENFNESKYVAFATFAAGLVWIACVFTYFATRDAPEFQTAVISFTIQMIGLGVLICLFGPRVFIMIVWPSKNVITTATTAKGPNTTAAANRFELQESSFTIEAKNPVEKEVEP